MPVLKRGFAVAGLASVLALGASVGLPGVALADELAVPAADANDGLQAGPSEGDSRGDYTDPKNPTNVELTTSGRRNFAYIQGVRYSLSGNTWTARVKAESDHALSNNVVICDSINGSPVTAVQAQYDQLDVLTLGKNVDELTMSNKGAVKSLVIPAQSGLMDNNGLATKIYLQANGKVYFEDAGVAADGADYLGTALYKFAQTQGKPSGCFELYIGATTEEVNKPNTDRDVNTSGMIDALPYLAVGTPDAVQATFAADETGTFAYAVYSDHAELVRIVPAYYSSVVGKQYVDPVVAETIGGKPVTIIAEAACRFANITGTVSIPKTVTTIAAKAFQPGPDEAVFSVVLEEGTQLASIGENAFALGSGGLKGSFGPAGTTGIVIPASVKEIGSGAFAGAKAESVVFEEGCTAKVSKDAFAASSITKVDAPSTVTTTDGNSIAGAFEGMKIEGKKIVLFSEGTTVYTLEVPFGTDLDSALTGAKVPEREGYTFKGWSLNDELLNGSFAVAQDIELTAVWEKNPEPEPEPEPEPKPEPKPEPTPEPDPEPEPEPTPNPKPAPNPDDKGNDSGNANQQEKPAEDTLPATGDASAIASIVASAGALVTVAGVVARKRK